MRHIMITTPTTTSTRSITQQPPTPLAVPRARLSWTAKAVPSRSTLVAAFQPHRLFTCRFNDHCALYSAYKLVKPFQEAL